jgi:hypothetical protein
MSHRNPRGAVEQATDTALDTFVAGIERAGGKVERAAFYAVVEGLKPNGVTAGYGFDGASDLLASLLAHAEQLAQAGGIELRIISTPEIGHG